MHASTMGSAVDHKAPAGWPPTILLLVGAAAGIALAAAGIVGGRGASGGLGPGVVARVNGEAISADEYERLLAAIASDRKQPLDADTRRRVLDRIIDEELLLQRALELGFARADRRIRGELTRAVIESVLAEAEAEEPGEQELRRLYESEPGLFGGEPRLRVRQMFWRVRNGSEESAARKKAEEARRRVTAGEPFEVVAERLAERPVAPIPDALLPPAKLRDYLGPSVTRAVLSLRPGQVSAPVRSGFGYHVVQLIERRESRPPPFEEVRDVVRAEWVRRRGEDALRAYLADLRDRARIEVRSGLFEEGR